MSFVVLCFVFFFKQKTAYEMRISDWSSDVCSSDLKRAYGRSSRTENRCGASRLRSATGRDRHGPTSRPSATTVHSSSRACEDRAGSATGSTALRSYQAYNRASSLHRSEEHTSELQSLMRISYAVFCFKKNTANI